MNSITKAATGAMADLWARLFLQKFRAESYAPSATRRVPTRARTPSKPGKAGDKIGRMAKEGRLTMKGGGNPMPFASRKGEGVSMEKYFSKWKIGINGSHHYDKGLEAVQITTQGGVEVCIVTGLGQEGAFQAARQIVLDHNCMVELNAACNEVGEMPTYRNHSRH